MAPLKDLMMVEKTLFEVPKRNECDNFFHLTFFSLDWLTHFSQVLHCFTLWKHQKTFRFSSVFRGYSNAALGWNGLISQKQPFADTLQNRYPLKFYKFHSKTLVLESLFNKGVRTPFFPEHIRWLLLIGNNYDNHDGKGYGVA